MTDTTLLPCPFCGGAAETNIAPQRSRVMCANGCCETATVAIWNGRAVAPREDGYSAGVRAAAAWFRERATDENGDLMAAVMESDLLADAPALPDARAGAVEPVAWMVEHCRAETVFLRLPSYIPPNGGNYTVTPLYAAPPTPACTATDGPASACVYRAPGLGTAATFEKG